MLCLLYASALILASTSEVWVQASPECAKSVRAEGQAAVTFGQKNVQSMSKASYKSDL